MHRTNNNQTLDDVDFTVLAATSVLGDLMEKCPPAEACRDAFERMSKATVQMCMSTTGFGFGKDRDEPGMPSRPTLSNTERSRATTFSEPIGSQYSHPSQSAAVRPRRPPPRFDMNLRDLFPEEIDTHDLPSQSVPQYMFGGSSRLPQQGQSQVMTSQSTQPSATRTSGHINAGLGMSANNGSNGQSNQYFNTQQQQSPFYNTSGYGSEFVGIPGMDFLNSAPGDDFNSDMSGIDLGFGMGTEFQHDWNDGTQLDLFDGFFFGNGAGGA